MIVCYDDFAYSYYSMVFGMCLFAPIALAVIIGFVVLIWEKLHGKK